MINADFIDLDNSEILVNFKNVKPHQVKGIKKILATVEEEVRKILNFIGCPINPDDTKEEIYGKMRLMNLDVKHVNVTEDPKLNGWWVLQDNEPLIILTDPKIEGNKITIKRVIP